MPTARALALGGTAAFLLVVAALHLLRPDVSLVERFVSEYGRGWSGPLMSVAFACWAVGIGATAVVAARARPPGRPVARVLTAGGLAVAAAGAGLATLFATQTVAGELPAGVARTSAGRLHDLGTLLLLAGLLLAALASLRLVRGLRYRLTVAGLAVVLLAIVPVLVALGFDAPGLGQRGFILVGCAFLWRFVVEAGAAGRPGAPVG